MAILSKALRLLIVEDQPDDAALMELSFTRAGVPTVTRVVSRRRELEKALDEDGWDAILSDHALPDMDSGDVLDLLQQRNVDVPCIVVSGAIGEESAAAAMRAGAADFVSKERLDRLVPAVEREIRDAAIRRARRGAEERLRLVKAAVESVEEGIFITTTGPTPETLLIVMVNCGFARMTGYTPAEAEGAGPALLIGPETDAQLLEELWGRVAQGHSFAGEMLAYRKDGAGFMAEWQVTPIPGEGGEVTHWVWVLRDVTERRRAAEQLQEQERLFRLLADNASDVVALHRPDGTCVYISPSVERILGYQPEELLEKNVGKLVRAEDREVLEQAFAAALEQERPLRVTYRIRKKNGRCIWFESTAQPYRDYRDGSVYFQVTSRDISERKAFEAQLEYETLHDPLTRLPNRVLFSNRLEHALIRASNQDRQVAVLFLQVENIDLINSTVGYQLGDQVLVYVADRIRACVGPGDSVGRQSGDQFAVLLEDATGLPEVLRTVERIHQELQGPVELSGREIFLAVNTGIAMSRPAEARAADLLRYAGIALERARRRGKFQCQVYESTMSVQVQERFALEVDLRRALKRGELQVHYQPIVSLSNRTIEGVEALVRWPHPERGLLSPAEFIPLAEETELILPLGRFVLGQACQQVQAWRRRCPDTDLYTSVNLSAHQFREPSVVTEIFAAIKATGIHPRALQLEVTESAMFADRQATFALLRQLKTLGVRVAIDDFGTGYSSLSCLRDRYAIDTLKIDGSFVSGLGRQEADTAIVKGIILLAKALELDVVAEGIETAEQMHWLRNMGCEKGQGYYLATPLPADRVEKLLMRQSRRRNE